MKLHRILACLFLLAQISLAQVEVSLQAQTISDKMWARLTIFVKNVGTTPVIKPKVAYEIMLPAGEIPMVELWNVGPVNASVEKITDTKWNVWLSLDADLAAGDEWNGGSGALVGVHLPDYSTWEPTSAPSFDGNTGAKVVNRKIRTWDGSGRLIWGEISDMQPPASPVGESSVAVEVGNGGRCNVLGTVLLVPTDRLDFWCQEDATHHRPQVWLDGVLQASDKYPTLFPDGKNHRIQVSFPPKPTFPLQVITSGPGRCEPLGTSAVFAGDTAWVGCAANEGAVLQTLSVGGVSVDPKNFTGILNVTGARQLTAVFSNQQVTGQSLEIKTRREDHSSRQFSAFHLQAKNTGSQTLAKGWKIRFPFRVPTGLTPVFNSWDVPSATSRFEALGQGWWMLELTSTADLLPGAYTGDGREFYFALSVTRNPFNWDRTGDVALPGNIGLFEIAPYVRAFSVTGVPLAGKDWMMSSQRSVRPSVIVEYKDEANGKEMARPRIILRNVGNTALSDFSYEYYFCTEGGRLPNLNNWYGTTSDIKIYAVGGHCYTLRYNFPDVTVGPGEDLPNASGNSLGLYYSKNTEWIYTNDWSHIHSTSSFVENPRIPVFDRWGNRIWGTLWTDPGSPGSTNGSGTGTGSGPIGSDGVPVQASDFVQKKDVPVIVRQPVGVSVAESQTATFETRAIASGTDLQYQWRLNGVDLAGASDPVLVLDRVRAEQDGDELTCLVKTATGFVLSNPAILSVIKVPKPLLILVPPRNDTVTLGATARFDVYATGEEPFIYQWFKGNSPLKGENSPGLAVTVASPTDTSARYWVRITDAFGVVRESAPVAVVLRKNGRGGMKISLAGNFTSKESMDADFVDMKFRLFGQVADGDALWVESHPAIPLKNGEWIAELGSSDAAGLAAVVASQSTLYLEIVLDAGIPRVLGPRVAMTTAPFALQAGKRLVLGKGTPTRSDLPIGTLWMDTDLSKTWIRDDLAWRALEQ